MSIEKNDKHNIGDLLSSRNPFVIPKYQRAYSWTKEEVEAFCDDIKDIESEYFFGGLVSVFEIANNGPGRIYKVVDGQQRLATFTILLNLIKEAFSKISIQTKDTIIKETTEALAEQITKQYLTYVDTRNKPPKKCNRLTMSRIDDSYFKAMLNNEDLKGEVESHLRMKQARDIINKKLIAPIMKIKVEQDKITQLERLKDNVLDNSVVIHIVCSNLGDAYQLFEVLNDRGRDLAICDYLRSTTLELINDKVTTKDEENICILWDDIQGKKNVDSYIKDYLRSYEGTIKRSQVHKQIQSKFFDKPKITTDEVLARVKNIHGQYKVYDKLINGEWPYLTGKTVQWDKNRLNLLINNLKHTLCIPLLMAIQEVSKEEDFNLAVQYIEKVVFKSINILGQRANKLSDIYSKTIKNIRTNQEFEVKKFKKVLDEYMDTECDDDNFKKELHRKLVYDENNINKIKYFLMTMEAYYTWYKDYQRDNSKSIPKADKSIILTKDSTDIEHVYSKESKNKDKDLEEVKHSIGNLTLWDSSVNRGIGNDDFSIKKNEYKKSAIGITRIIGEEIMQWTIKEIADREELYCQIATLVFNLNLYK